MPILDSHQNSIESHIRDTRFLDSALTQPHIAKPIQEFCTILGQWAKIHNLTSIHDSHSLQVQIQDSLLPIAFLQPFHTCIDVGSGAGFPALLLACYYRQSAFYLLEPRKKRVSFLENAIARMGLTNVSVIGDYSYNVRGIQGDLISSRAVCQSDILVQGSRHLLAPNGAYLLYKGTDTASESKLLSDMSVAAFSHSLFGSEAAHRRTYLYARFKN